MELLFVSVILVIIALGWSLTRGGVFSTLRRFDERKKLDCYIGFLVPTIEGIAYVDPMVRESFERDFRSWVEKANQRFGWAIGSKDSIFKPDSSELLGLGSFPLFRKFSDEQRLICYDTFLVPFFMNMARRNGGFRRTFVEGFANWERDMRRLFG